MAIWKQGAFSPYISCQWCDHWEYATMSPEDAMPMFIQSHVKTCKKAPPFPLNKIQWMIDYGESKYCWDFKDMKINLQEESWIIFADGSPNVDDGPVISWVKYAKMEKIFTELGDEFIIGPNHDGEYSSPWAGVGNAKLCITEEEWLEGKKRNTGFVEYSEMNDDEMYINKRIKNVQLEEAIELALEWIREIDPTYRKGKEKKKLQLKAKECEKNLDYDEAIKIWKKIGKSKEATRVRKLKADLAAPKTEIHGDYIDDRDTIVKDSVLNRSNVGAGGKSKAEEIKEIKELLDSGAIDDDEFKQMKKEILGK